MRVITYDHYGSPEVLHLADMSRPAITPDDVLVRVRASSVNPADLAIVTGRPHLVRAIAGLRRPRRPVPGIDLAGVVDAVGARVTTLKPGDEVYGEASQTWAEYACVSPSKLFAKPARLTFEQAACVPLAGLTAWQALDRAHVQPGQRVLVNGASGGVGHFAVQVAKAQGAQVTAVCSARNVDLVAGLGADHVIDYAKSDYTTLGQRYDVVLDAVVTHRLSDVRRALAPAGVYLSVGTAPATGPGEGGLLGPLPRIAEVTVRSLTARPQRLITVAASANRGIAQMTELIESGAVTPHIEQTYPLAQLPDALRRLATHHVSGKLAITI